MVVVNAIASALVLLGIIFYVYIYPKKRINLFVLLIIVSILPIISIFRNGDYESGDFNIHIYRTMSFYDSLKEGIFMPSWAAELNATYGYPLFIFNYPLPYYLLSFIHFLGLGFITSMKLFLAFNLILSGIFMYLFSKDLFKNSKSCFIASVFYIFTPYHLIDLHFKVVIGEILAFTLLPLIFFFVQRFYVKRNFIFLLLAAAFFAFLVMTHAVIAFFAAPIMLAYIIFLNKDHFKNGLIQSVFVFTIAGIISLYVWLAPFIFNQYTFIQRTHLNTVYFPIIKELLYSPYRWGFLFQGPNGQIPFLVGYTQIFVLIMTLILLVLKKMPNKNSTDQKFWLITSITIIFLITPYSKFLWEHFSFVKAAGSHRLLLLLTFTISILSGFLSVAFAKKKFLINMLIIITIGYTILNWGQRRVIPEINDNILRANLWKSTSEGEAHFYANTKWVDVKHPWFSKLPKGNIEIIKGKGEIKTLNRTSTKHTYIVSAKTPLNLTENTLYFPGWKAKSNGNDIALTPNYLGVTTLTVPKGLQLLELTYNDISFYKISKIISALGFLVVLIFMKLTKRSYRP